MNIGQYTIVSASSDRDLIDSVMIHIRKGWQPVGGAVPVVDQDGLPILIQTLIRPKMSETSGRV
jgi:hypothetical protein